MPVAIRTKLLAAPAVVVILLVVVSATAVSLVLEANARTERVVALERATSFYRDLRDALASELLGVTTALASTDSQVYDDARRQFDLAQLNLDRLAVVAADDPDRVHDIQTLHDEFRDVMARVLDLGRTGNVAAARDLYAREGTTLADRLDRRVGELVHKAEVDVVDAVDTGRAAVERSQWFLGTLAVIAIGLAGLLGVALSLSIIDPVRDIGAGLARISRGEFSSRVSVANRDEFGTLARNVDEMAAELGDAYAKLEATNRHKSEFLANMSHELRTPLNAIIGFSDVLLQRLFGELNDKQQEYVGDILSSGRHQLALVNDILDLSKVEAGKMELEPSPVALVPLIDSSILLVRGRATSHGIAVAADVATDLGVITADERKLKQVLVNLLSNAVKFTPDGGRIDVRALRDDQEVRIAVKDTGVGIGPEDRERIFEEFEQTRAGRQAEGSTGLGLSLARKFVELHGGRIWVESEIGRGSTFTFALPAIASS